MRDDPTSLKAAWAREATKWIEWARTPGHDSFFWRFNLPCLLSLLPPPHGRVLDLGCGEGRLCRELAARGYDVIGMDPVLPLVRAAGGSGSRVAAGEAAALPLRSGSVSLVVACMVLQDLDDPEAAVSEVARVLVPGGTFCFCVLHPVSTSGFFLQSDGRERFTFLADYFESARYAIPMARGGRSITFHGLRQPLSRYFGALEANALHVAALREPQPDPDWVREEPRVAPWCGVPNSLHIRAVKAA